VSWITGSEINNNYFILERSSDNEAFEELARIQGNGTTSEQQEYTVTDKFPLNGYNYYRLTQVDFDGHRQSWPPAVCECHWKRRVLLYPNPAPANEFTLQFTGDRPAACSIALTDMNGKNCYIHFRNDAA
jgi:hypothetical protein